MNDAIWLTINKCFSPKTYTKWIRPISGDWSVPWTSRARLWVSQITTNTFHTPSSLSEFVIQYFGSRAFTISEFTMDLLYHRHQRWWVAVARIWRTFVHFEAIFMSFSQISERLKSDSTRTKWNGLKRVPNDLSNLSMIQMSIAKSFCTKSASFRIPKHPGQTNSWQIYNTSSDYPNRFPTPWSGFVLESNILQKNRPSKQRVFKSIYAISNILLWGIFYRLKQSMPRNGLDTIFCEPQVWRSRRPSIFSTRYWPSGKKIRVQSETKEEGDLTLKEKSQYSIRWKFRLSRVILIAQHER